MPSVADTRSSPLVNHLGWQGWQVDLPTEWNPLRLSGSARAGTVVVADLERPRVELDWRRVRSIGGADLSRAGGSRRHTSLSWKPLAGAAVGAGIIDGRRAVAENGDVLALLLSGESRRLLFVRIASEPGGNVEPTADRILAAIADAGGASSVPWCVYGFAWSVPAGFQLSSHRFAAGRAALTFRRGRRLLGPLPRKPRAGGANDPAEGPTLWLRATRKAARLRFERWTLAGDRSEPAEADDSTGTDVGYGLEHRGHEIRMARVPRQKLWDRLAGGQAWQARWICRSAKRGYRVEAAGPEADRLLRAAVLGVECH